MIDFESIKAVDPEICDAMRKELTRQREHLELIASEKALLRRLPICRYR